MNYGTYIAGGILGLILHEAGHVLACRMLGVKVKKVGISWKGAYVQHAECSPAAHTLIALCGPIANLALAVVLPWEAAAANLILGVMNLLPYTGSDGKTILNYFRKTA
jgi:Zn-dependent protease